LIRKMKTQSLTIATAQSFISKDVRENGLEIRRLMKLASQAGARLIHFPEGAMSGYAKRQIKNWEEVDWKLLRGELELGVDCVLLSAYSDEAMFAVQAQGHAACTNMWLSFSVPAQMSRETPSRMIAPGGTILATCEANSSTLVTTVVNPDAPEWEIPLKRAKPWRASARKGDIYRTTDKVDLRSLDRSQF
jgi:hypothetical protein